MKLRATVGCAMAVLVSVALHAQERWGQRAVPWSEYTLIVNEAPARFRMSVEGDDDQRSGSLRVYPTLGALKNEARNQQLMMSLGVLHGAAKRFDDQLRASIDLLAQQGAPGVFLGRAALVSKLEKALAAEAARDPGSQEAWARMRAACLLGGLALDAQAPPCEMASSLIARFDRDEGTFSRPIGIYATTPELSRIYRQDRFLQQAADPRRPEGAWLVVLAKAIRSDPELGRSYETTIALAALTNPPAACALTDLDRKPCPQAAWLPACRSAETNLVTELYGTNGLPPGHAVMDDFIAAIRRGRVNLALTPESGWYDRQTWALEPLIRPAAAVECRKVERHASYAKYCEDVFRARVTTQRETQVKDLGGAICTGPAQSGLSPQLSIEPQVTVYRRVADSYRFVRERLERIVGAEALDAAPMVEIRPGAKMTVRQGLAGMERKFNALAALALHEIGGQPEMLGTGTTEADALALAMEARAIVDAGFSAEDLAHDARVIVPFAYDAERGEYRCWAVVGVCARELEARYAAHPLLTALDAQGGKVKLSIPLETATMTAPAEVWIECSQKQPPTREEFRAACDRCATIGELRRVLNAVR